MTTQLVTITHGPFTFGLVIDAAADRVKDAPPYARWTMGHRASAVLGYYQGRGAQVMVLPPDQDPPHRPGPEPGGQQQGHHEQAGGED